MFKEYRKKLGLSQEQLALNANLSTRQIQRIEKKQELPTLPTFKKLILALGITDEDILKYIKTDETIKNKEVQYK